MNLVYSWWSLPWFQAKGQTNNGSERLHGQPRKEQIYPAQRKPQSPHLMPGPEAAPVSMRLTQKAKWMFRHPVGPTPMGSVASRQVAVKADGLNGPEAGLGGCGASFSGGEEVGSCVGGGALPARSGGAYL